MVEIICNQVLLFNFCFNNEHFCLMFVPYCLYYNLSITYFKDSNDNPFRIALFILDGFDPLGSL